MHATTFPTMRIITVSAVLALVAGLVVMAPADARSAVPFRALEVAQGAANVVGECGETAIVIDDEAAGTGTHVGRFEIAFVECFDFAAGTFTVEFVITAANGDTLDGTYAGGFTSETNWVAEAKFAGGTGRFADADGRATLHGTIGADGYEQTWTGWISSPGHGHGR